MKYWHLFFIMASIYASPHLGNELGSFFACVTVIFGLWAMWENK